MVLPAEGRDGPVPKWPYEGRAPRLWAELWRMPQAVAWEQHGSQRVVARYCALVLRAEETMRAGLLGEVRQLEDRLGMTAMALLRLRWTIAPTVPVEPVPLVPPRRIRAVIDDD